MFIRGRSLMLALVLLYPHNQVRVPRNPESGSLLPRPAVFGLIFLLEWRLFFCGFPLQCLSLFGNPWSIHAWVETVKSAFNARSKIWERSYQFHGSRCNGINLGCLRDTRISWPNCKLHWPWNHFPHIWWLRAFLRALLGVSRPTAAIADFYS